MLNQKVSRRGLLPAVTIAAALTVLFSRPAGAPAPPPKHGLTGAYYVSTLEVHSDVNPSGKDWFVQVWMDPSDFQLPRPFTAPAAVRVDPQIAFGQGKGFVSRSGKQTQWWPTGFAIPAGWTIWQATIKPWDQVRAVIWKGYLHLPKAGTYYLATASRGASAVYLNQARVALNGTYGGVLVSDAFTYAKEDLRDYLQNLAYGREDLLFRAQPGDSYVIPVTVETPGDVPIEVRYNGWEGKGRGIDLFWVTPDSPRDSLGKPVARIVPSDVLYTEPPSPIEQSTVRVANSMLSADFLYFPSIRTDKDVTVTVRLADKDGNPVAGKRVYIGSLVSYGGADLIKQPERPTDEKGETTARMRPGEGYKVTHDSKIFATDVTDLVDVAQVGHVTFQAGTVVDFFFPDAFSPYYDPDLIKAEPLPLTAGRPVTISVALENRTKDAAELTATFKAKGLNIGAVRWPEIGKVEHIRLKPGEARRVSINWTPGQATTSLCFKVDVSVQFDGRAGGRTEGRVLTAFALPVGILAQQSGAAPQNAVSQRVQQVDTPPQYVPPPMISGPGGGLSPSSSVQRNMGPVSPKTDWGFDKEYWRGVEERSKVITDWCEGIKGLGEKAAPALGGTYVLYPPIKVAVTKIGERVSSRVGTAVTLGLVGICAWDKVAGGIGHMIAADPPDTAFLEVYTPDNYHLPAPTRLEGVPEAYSAALDASLRNLLQIVALSTAVLTSVERYHGAKAAGNEDTANRQLLAYTNYTSEVAQAFERGAHLVENLAVAGRASGVPDVPFTADQVVAAQQRLGTNGFTDDWLAAFAWVGVSEQFLKDELLPAAMSVDPKKAAGSYYDKLRELAGFYRWAGTSLVRKSSLTYLVGNPKDKEETIDLFIRPVSIPTDWKLTIVNAEQPAAPNHKAQGNDPPEFPVREVAAGKHYAVTLPAKGQVTVSSVLVPVGELGAHTTARWAVEGKIGDELIGGMVHEMNVPYTTTDLKLPPVGSKEVAEELPTPGKAWARTVIEIAGAILVMGMLVFIFIFWHRRRAKVAP